MTDDALDDWLQDIAARIRAHTANHPDDDLDAIAFELEYFIDGDTDG